MEVREEDTVVPFVVLGHKFSGKTSLCKKYIYNTFTAESDEFNLKTCIGGFQTF